MERHGGNIYDKDIRIDFSVNVSPFGMTEGVRQAAILGVEESVRYPDPAQGRLRLRCGRPIMACPQRGSLPGTGRRS